MAFQFLRARWSNLALITYAFEPRVLDSLLPPGCEADVVDGRAFASLVAFDFLDTRVLGIRWPGHVHFPEVNLRFYVRERGTGGRRGVSFVSEFVPRGFIAFAARTLYNEPYRRVAMTSATRETDATLTIEHRLRIAGRDRHIRVTGRKPPHTPAADSVEHFFKEHEWGFGRSRFRGRKAVYRVMHDVWSVLPVESHELNFDFAEAYGDRWTFLNESTPHHVALAVGGPVSVSPWRGEMPA